MVPRLVPEISSLDAFCDTGAGIGDSRSWINEQSSAHTAIHIYPTYIMYTIYTIYTIFTRYIQYNKLYTKVNEKGRHPNSHIFPINIVNNIPNKYILTKPT